MLTGLSLSLDWMSEWTKCLKSAFPSSPNRLCLSQSYQYGLIHEVRMLKDTLSTSVGTGITSVIRSAVVE